MPGPSRPPRLWISFSLAAAILAVAALTGSLWGELPLRVAGWGSFGWPALAAGRWGTLVSSLVLTRDPFMALTMAAAVAGALGVYERQSGHGRALAVAAVAHVSGSVLVAVGAGALGRTGWPVAVRAAENLDYGASMVVAGAVGALASRHRRLLPVVGVGVVVALVVHHQIADWAHLVAAPAGYLADRARRPRRALMALAGTAALTAWLVVNGWLVVVDATDDVRFASLGRPSPVPTATQGHVERLDYRSPALGDRVMVAWVYVPPRPRGPLPVALFLHGIPGAPDDWLAGGQLASSLDRAIAGGLLPPALAIVPDGEGMHDPRAGWADIPRQHLLTSVSRDLLSAVGRRWAADLGAGQVAVVGVGRGAAGAARQSWHDRRIGFVAVLDPLSPPRVRAGVRLLQLRSEAGLHPGPNRWGHWRSELPGVLGWLGSEGFGVSSAGAR
jgi:hypothetical protein